MKRLIILIGFVTIITLGFYLYYVEGSLPVDKSSRESVVFVVRRGENLDTITNNLSDKNLIRSKIIFYTVVKKLGIERSIQAGDFRLSPSMDVEEIANAFTHGTLDVWMTIIEGTRKEEVAQVVSQNLNIPEIEFLKSAKEGYLFPDTYLIPKDATAVAVLQIFETNFNRRFSNELKENAKQKNLTVDEVITLASLIEREALFDEDRIRVANVLLKRLANGIKLDIDATVQYAVGYQSDKKSWWKKNLTVDDLTTNSPYNTYKNAGLPPGPIASPGLASIQAVLNANSDTPYLYYVSDKTGHLHFAGTLEEHNNNVAKYVR